MQPLYDPSAPKRATNVSINKDLLDKARHFKINVSATLEAALQERLKQAQAEQWLAENRDAIKAYNQFVDEHGVFSDGLRGF